MSIFKISTILLMFISIVLSSCKKEKELELSDIVQTDKYGNVLDTNNSTDWTFMNIDDREPFRPLSTSTYDNNGSPIIPNNFNFNCSSDSLSIKIYPNPVQVNEKCTLEISANKKFIDFNMSYGAYGGSGSGVVGGINNNIIRDNGKTIFIELGQEYNWPYENVELYLFMLTEDSCAYYSYGKIKYLN